MYGDVKVYSNMTPAVVSVTLVYIGQETVWAKRQSGGVYRLSHCGHHPAVFRYPRTL
jgi:hypothetical protein